MGQQIQREQKKELTDSMNKGTDNDEASCCDHQTLSKGANGTHEIHSQLNGMKRNKSRKKRQQHKKKKMEGDASGKSSEEKNIVESLTDNSSVPAVEQEACGKEGDPVCIMNSSTDVDSADKNDDEASQFDHGILTSNGRNLSKGANCVHEIRSELNGVKRRETSKQGRRKKRRMESGDSEDKVNLEEALEGTITVESLTDNSSVPAVEQETRGKEANTVCIMNASTNVDSADKNDDEASQFDHDILTSNGHNLSKGANGAHEIHSELNGVKRRETRKQRRRKKGRMESGDSEEALEGTSTVESLIDTSLAQVAENNAPILPRTLRSSTRKKLLVLDLNGLLCDVVHGYPKTHKRHERVGKSAVFKRPFCDDFMRFCCEKFDIGVWSSRKMENVVGVVKLIMSGVRKSLLFCWDASQCTYTGYKTVENNRKPLVLKQLKKLWNNEGGDLPWEEGDYSPSNTLLIDDSPYKALCNPPYTGVFPYPYSYMDENDSSLGPGGDLRVYLEGLALADDVQKYVREHPFGRHAISPANPSWKFYERVVNRIR